jgi:hypothetical protein
MRIPQFKLNAEDRIVFDKGPEQYKLDGKLTDQVFGGSINLCNDLTAYRTYTVSANVTPVIEPNAIIGGSAEIRFIGDGSHTVTFSAFTASASSSSYSTTLAAINKVVFYFDGTTYFYSLTVL